MEYATLLREKSLQIVESWNKKHGKFHKQVRCDDNTSTYYLQLGLGHTYLHHTLKMNFVSLSNDPQREAQQREKLVKILPASLHLPVVARTKDFTPQIQQDAGRDRGYSYRHGK